MPDLSRRRLLRAGGTIALVTATAGIATAGQSLATQSLWRYCHNCSGLWFSGNGTTGACPNGGAHVLVGSGNYNLKFATDAGVGQTSWRYCHQCDGLWFSGGGETGNCPGSFFSGHSMSTSGDYKLESSAASGAGQTNWRYCNKCLGLWFGLNGGNVCPDGGQHTLAGSGNYKLRQI